MKLASRFLGAILVTLLTLAPAIAAESFTVVLDGLQSSHHRVQMRTLVQHTGRRTAHCHCKI